MNVLVSGSTGFIGSALVPHLVSAGHSVVRLVRHQAPRDTECVRWDPARGAIDAPSLEGIDAVVHLAGENIGKTRWTEGHKRRVYDSRILGTTLLSRTVANLVAKPSAFLSASAIGYYGNRGDEILSEESASGSGFTAGVCRDWEAATRPAEDAGIRVVHSRNGLVLDPSGSLLRRMLLPFRLGLGGKLGSGKQYMSWISLRDTVRAMRFLIESPSAIGAFNLTAPNPVRNIELTKTLGRVLRRPTVVPVPRAALAAVFTAEAADELLASLRVLPRGLERAAYDFEDTDLESALRYMLGKAPA